jgi:DNA-binding transcriptional regulator YhcF (GntR family)
VRDLAAEFEVNRNTVMRTYTNLQEAGIFDNKRGIGFFIAENALKLISSREKGIFQTHDLPDFIVKIKLLKLTSYDLSDLLDAIKINDQNEKK